MTEMRNSGCVASPVNYDTKDKDSNLPEGYHWGWEAHQGNHRGSVGACVDVDVGAYVGVGASQPEYMEVGL